MTDLTFDKIVSLCKRRGFVWQNSEIYGGMANLYDFGPYGTLLDKNIKDLWFKHTVLMQENIYPINGMILMHPKAWEASGHITGFSDPLIDCSSCHKRFRPDKLKDWSLKKDNKTGEWKVLKQGSLICPDCGGKLIPEIKPFNLLMSTELGTVEGKKSKVYLKGESCQNIYLNYKLLRDTMRAKIPFGIAQIGKAFRNEITLGKFLFRLKEFEQMDIEFYVNPNEADTWYEKWKNLRFDWYTKILGISENNLKWFQHPSEERIFYAKDAWDILYKFPHGFDELEGIHNRSDYDCKVHSKFSGENLDYLDEITGERFFPYIIETSVGVSRIFMMLFSEFYKEDEINNRKRVYLAFPPDVAPIKAAIFPLQKDSKIINMAKDIYNDIKIKSGIIVEYDEAGSIGKRYRRQDEIGTPYCITVDFESLNDKKVTVRDRDSLKQERIEVAKLAEYLAKKLGNI